MEPSQLELDYSRRRLSTSSEERTIFYIDDMSPPVETSPSSDYGHANVTGTHQQQQQQHHHHHNHHHHHQHQGLCEPPDVTLVAGLKTSPRPRSQQRRRNSSVSSQCGGGNVNGLERPRRQRRPSEFSDHAVRRSSVAGRSRTNSCVRPTPLGDGRRASVCKKGAGNRQRRGSAAHRRDSIRPVRSEGGTRTPSMLLTPTSVEAAEIKDPLEIQRARRHRRVAMVLLATFLFILSASVLAVIVTLTHSSFHKPPTGSKELAEHRATSARKTRSC